MIEFLVPFSKSAQTFTQRRARLKAKVALQRRSIRIGHRHIARLHRYELFVRLEVIISTQQLLLQNRHKVQQVLRMAVADVVHLVRRQRQTILAHPALRRCLHHALYTLDNIVDIGKITLTIAIVENLNRLASQQLVRKAKVRHIRTAGRAINREEA